MGVDLEPFLRCPGILKPTIVVSGHHCRGVLYRLLQALQFFVMICMWAVMSGCEANTTGFIWFVLVLNVVTIGAISALMLTNRWENLRFDKAFFVSLM